MPSTRPSPEAYFLGAQLRLSGWGSAFASWDEMAEKQAHWQNLRAHGVDLFFPPAAESAADAQFRKALIKNVRSEMYARTVPHPWAWMFGVSPLTQSSDWTMRVAPPALLAAKDAIIKQRIALLRRLAPAFAVPRTQEDVGADRSMPTTDYFMAHRALPRGMPAMLLSRLHAVGDETVQAALRREWLQVGLQEEAINREFEKTGLPFVRVHAQLVEVTGPPPVEYAEADLAAVRQLAQKYARMFEGGGEEAVMHHVYAMAHRAAGKIDSFPETHGPYGRAAAETQAMDQVGAYRLLTRARRPKVLMLRVFVHHRAQSLLANAKKGPSHPHLAAVLAKQEAAQGNLKHRHHARLLETLRGPRRLRLQDACDQNNKTPAHVLSDAVVLPARDAAAARGALPHQHKVLDRMEQLEDRMPACTPVPPPEPGDEEYNYVTGVPRVPGLALARAHRSHRSPEGASFEAKKAQLLERLAHVRRPGGVVMQDVGLGKMIEMLLLMKRQNAKVPATQPTLVLCPAAVAPTWVEEARRRHLACRLLDFKEAAAPEGVDAVVCAYEKLTAHMDTVFPDGAGTWGRVVLDESQKVVGANSKRAQSILTKLQLPAHAGTPVWCLTVPEYSVALLLQYARKLFFHRNSAAQLHLSVAHDMYSVRQDCTANPRNVAPLQRILGGVFVLQTKAHLREAGVASAPLHRHVVELPTPGYLRVLCAHHGEVLQRRVRQEKRPWMLALTELAHTVLGIRAPPAALAMPPLKSENDVLTSADAVDALGGAGTSFAQSTARRLSRKRKQKQRATGSKRRKGARSGAACHDAEEDEDAEEAESDGEEDACPICHEEYDDDSVTLTVIRACGHAFHRACLQQWLDTGRPACPVCRAAVRPADLLHFSTLDAAGGAGAEPAPLPRALEAARAAVPPLADSPKVAYLRDALLAKIPEDEKVVVMCRSKALHGAVVESLSAAGVPLSVIRGGQSPEEREKQRAAFQELPPAEARVMVMTTATAGVGITLTRANHLVLLEPALSPKVKEQAVGRVHRQCQARPVHVHTLAMRGTLDTRVLEVDAAAAARQEEAYARGRRRGCLPRTARKHFLLTGADA